jgi:hypothetical protein
MAERFLSHLKETMRAVDFPACCTRRASGAGPDHNR